MLDGYQATCHWSVIDCLKLFPKVTVVNGFPRYLRDRNRFTGGGISSSVRRGAVHGAAGRHRPDRGCGEGRCRLQRVQLSIQYNPKPPFAGGDPASVDFSVFDPVEQGMKTFRKQVCDAVRAQIGA